jgi:hypothetical protein
MTIRIWLITCVERCVPISNQVGGIMQFRLKDFHSRVCDCFGWIRLAATYVGPASHGNCLHYAEMHINALRKLNK